MFNNDSPDLQKQDLESVLNATKSSESALADQSQMNEPLSWDCEDGVCVLSWKPNKMES